MQHVEQFVGKQSRQEGKYLGISEAEPLWFYCVKQFSHKTAQDTIQFDYWILDISSFVSSDDTLSYKKLQSKQN